MSGGRAITPQMAAARRLSLPMTPRIALARRRTSPRPLGTLLTPLKKMVAWGEPWDVEDDDEEPSRAALSEL